MRHDVSLSEILEEWGKTKRPANRSWYYLIAVAQWRENKGEIQTLTLRLMKPVLAQLHQRLHLSIETAECQLVMQHREIWNRACNIAHTTYVLVPTVYIQYSAWAYLGSHIVFVMASQCLKQSEVPKLLLFRYSLIKFVFDINLAWEISSNMNQTCPSKRVVQVMLGASLELTTFLYTPSNPFFGSST